MINGKEKFFWINFSGCLFAMTFSTINNFSQNSINFAADTVKKLSNIVLPIIAI